MPSWFEDFEIKDKKIIVKATGAELPLGGEIFKEVLAWFPFYLSEKFRRLGSVFLAKSPKTDRLSIAFSPVEPRPWYLLAALTYRARIERVQDLAKADAVFYFEDETNVNQPTIPPQAQDKAFNFGCYDISKSRVARKFEHVFGYALCVDPLTYKGPIVVKSEKNGAHDGYQAVAPLAATDVGSPDTVYQRLIDNSVSSRTKDMKWAEDMRCPVVGGEISLIFVKRRPLEKRFANMNTSVTLHEPDELLSAAEREQLKDFAAAMRLDFGGMDVLRDKADGRIYVVDVNKTDMGPPIALSHADKSKAVDILSRQLVKLIRRGP